MSRSLRLILLYIWFASIISLSAAVTSASNIVQKETFDSANLKTMQSARKPVPQTSGTIDATLNTVINVSGGNVLPGPDSNSQNIQSVSTAAKSSLRKTAIKNMLAGWGVIQVLSILANAIKRVVPVAIQPFVQKDLKPFQAVICAAWCVYMVYTEGYKTFQLKFSPLVVKRAFGLSNNLSILNCLFAGPYSMGLFGATRKRMIVSWSVTIGVFALVKIVKKLPYPWRSIVDAGVVLGLGYGALAMCFQTIRAIFGYLPDVDECLPLRKEIKAVDLLVKK